MSLVKGLEEKQARDKEIYLSKLAIYLQSAGIDASFTHEQVSSLYDSVKEQEPVVRIAGENISRIVLRTRLFASCGLWQSISFFDYESALQATPPPQLSGKMKARVRPVIQNRFLGIFGGRVTSVRWTGGKLAEVLNQDKELSERLFSLSTLYGYPDIIVQFRDISTAEISGPQFDAPPPFLINVISYPDLPLQNDDLFYAFGLYNRISQHMGRMAAPD